jgi:hypothetical protein
MIKMSLKDKAKFFDREKVIKALDKAERRYLSKAGAFVRRRARSSMRRRKGSSPPGQPPSAHTGDLKRILFALELVRRAVIIGPIGFNKSNIPEALEYGGTVEIDATDRRTYKKNRFKIDIEATPYMGPALAKEVSNLPKIWRDSVK